MTQDVTTIDASNFNDFMNEPGQVKVLRFWATWCRPCIALEPTYNEVATEMKDTARFGEIDIDIAPELAGSFGIRSVPTVVVLKDGLPIDMVVGLNPKSQYIQAVKAA
ncbi:thioredoxin family protein [Pseudooceanicola sp. CBS1P-1]|uniref:Thioredoxin n=1 Tax=Pseudooceanicola albus TaxID=2692189 RepID=A0A6L7GE26_9RHOB|nr:MULTISPECIES: thioredoxin family protein [Pseudooceanicola]MBT9386861.1 thioredoxin family protein [Pseudooceanicola endophyticus]MXN21003.1 thioredoxin [Pseudooceanicola albus]